MYRVVFWFFLLWSTLLVGGCLTAVHAQQHHSYWYFGAGAGIRFAGDSVMTLTDSRIIANEGSASIADRNGKLLFYTDGISVYNARHALVPNGSGLWGNPSTTQVALIVPHPGRKNEWYIFTADANFGSKGIAFSRIRMDSSGAAGVVMEKNSELFAPAAEKLTAAVHANGRDFWLLIHEAGNNHYRAYLIDSTGIRADRFVVSESGTPQTVNWNASNAVGGIKVSPDGRKMAAAILGMNAFEIYDFDPATGKVSNAILLQDSVRFLNAYSVEFSPDSRFLYLSATGYKKVHQLFLYGVPQSEWKNNLIEIPFSGTEGQTSLQAGPDGKMYIGRAGAFLSAITFPNTFYPLCGVEEKAVDLKGRSCYLGLPNHFFYHHRAAFSYEHLCSGDSILFTLHTLQFDSAFWYINEHDSFKTEQRKFYHVFNTSGIYLVKLVLYTDGLADSVTQSVTVLPHVKTKLPADTILCANVAMDLTAFDSSYVRYRWSTGSVQPSIQVTRGGTYWVVTYNGACYDSDTFELAYKRPPQAFLGSDTGICEPDTILLQSARFGGSAFYWQQKLSADSFLAVTTPGLYEFRIENECGTAADTIEIFECECELYVPNAFSPDGDGLNDVFYAEGCEPSLFRMQIYNSWGQRVYASDDVRRGWDGKYNGRAAPEGIYSWSLEYTGSIRSYRLNKAISGTLILIR
jgi:gliding motility-associated-like protein